MDLEELYTAMDDPAKKEAASFEIKRRQKAAGSDIDMQSDQNDTKGDKDIDMQCGLNDTKGDNDAKDNK